MTYNFSNRHFLVVEDDEVSSELLYESLKLNGADVTHVNSGEKALDLLRAGNRYDLIVMDVCLPGMDGYDTTRQVHQIVPGIPVIAQTAYITDQQKAQAMQAGCVNFIAKPTKPDELFQLIALYL